jgi:transcriptional regulator with XRE-family HTH domain
MKAHWTAQSVKDYLFRIATDFIVQLENKMESLAISQDQLAKKLGVTKGAVSQWINHTGNVTLGKMIEYARALGMKVSVVAYEDDDPENKKGPIDAEIFRICWEQLGKPRDFWAIQDILTTNNVKFGRRSDDFKDFQASANIVTYPTYFSIERVAGNQTSKILNDDKPLSS